MSHLLTHLSKQLPIISVGSGMGVEEQFLIDHGYTVVCIEPANRKRDLWLTDKVLTRQPDFASVPAYLRAHPNYDGEVQLLLHYPLPDYGLYDITAIHDLKPRSLIIMATMGGSAGSFLLHLWLRRAGVPTLGKMATERSWATKFDFDCLIVDRYTAVKSVMQEESNGTYNEYGVANNYFVATLMRQGPYVAAARIASPEEVEDIQRGEKYTTRQMNRTLQYVVELGGLKK